jgi:hypothetical protein
MKSLPIDKSLIGVTPSTGSFPMPTLEVLCNLLVPKRHVRLIIVDDGPQLGVPAKIGHKVAHALDTCNKINDFFF